MMCGSIENPAMQYFKFIAGSYGNPEGQICGSQWEKNEEIDD
jgi:hypothetical protein